jgi:hypothetical protein
MHRARWVAGRVPPKSKLPRINRHADRGSQAPLTEKGKLRVRSLQAKLLPHHARLAPLSHKDGGEDICLGEGDRQLPQPGGGGTRQVHPGGGQILLQRGQGGNAGVTTNVFSGSLAARVEWHKVNVPPLVETGHFIGQKDQLHALGGDGARGHGGQGAVPRESKAG